MLPIHEGSELPYKQLKNSYLKNLINDFKTL